MYSGGQVSTLLKCAGSSVILVGHQAGLTENIILFISPTPPSRATRVKVGKVGLKRILLNLRNGGLDIFEENCEKINLFEHSKSSA